MPPECSKCGRYHSSEEPCEVFESSIQQAPEPHWVIVAQGEGARAQICEGDLREAIHRFMCVCGQLLIDCRTEGIREDIAQLEDRDEWSNDENGEPFSFGWPHETGSIILYRLGGSNHVG